MKTKALKKPILLSKGKTKPTSQIFKSFRLIDGSFFVWTDRDLSGQYMEYTTD